MTRSPIAKVLSIFSKHKIEALLMGGQACILYGAAEFSRDIDFVIMVSTENLQKLRSALKELGAKRIFVPELSEDALLKGHACHFRCYQKNVKRLRIDIMGVMRRVDSFSKLWKRRQEVNLPEIGKVAVIAIADLVRAKKTQRDKDWPMVRRLIEADIYRTSGKPSKKKVRFWLSECRTPELLISLATKYPDIASRVAAKRPLLWSAIKGNQEKVQKLLRAEEDRERESDRQYWKPLKTELETWRLKVSNMGAQQRSR